MKEPVSQQIHNAMIIAEFTQETCLNVGDNVFIYNKYSYNNLEVHVDK